MSVISLSGLAGSGKDLTGKLIQYYFYKNSKSNTPTLFENTDHISLEKWLEHTSDIHEKYSNWKIKKFADKLREVISIVLDVPLEFTYTDEFKNMNLPRQWDKLVPLYECDEYGNDGVGYVPITGRSALQIIGTDCFRDNFHVNTWVNATFAKYSQRHCNWIMTDARFNNELDYVKKLGGISIQILREDVTSNAGNHASENGLEGATFDYIIHNHGTIQGLYEQVEIIFDSLRK